MIRRSVLGLALVAAVAVPLGAQASHPSFAGTWVLDPSKTVNTTGAPSPDSISRTIVQHGDTVVIDTDVTTEMGTQHTHLIYGTDGKPWHNMISISGTMTDVSSVLGWQGSTLVVTTSISAMGSDFTQVNHTVVSSDGKSMTATQALTQDGNDLGTITLVFNKKP